MKISLVLLFALSMLCAIGQQHQNGIYKNSYGRFTGKYESNGMVVQVFAGKGNLQLYVPGAPVQELKEGEPGRFRSDAFSDEIFRFEEKEGKIEKLVSERGGMITALQKKTSFHQGINYPNAPVFIQATAFGKTDFRILSPTLTLPDSNDYLKGAVHELTHCIHLNIDYAPNNPRWLWEGLAMFESNWSFDPKEIDIIKNKQFPHLPNLENGMEYMLGYVIIEAIKDIWGQDAIISLVKKRGNVKEVLHLNIDEFEKQVFDHIYNKYIK